VKRTSATTFDRRIFQRATGRVRRRVIVPPRTPDDTRSAPTTETRSGIRRIDPTPAKVRQKTGAVRASD